MREQLLHRLSFAVFGHVERPLLDLESASSAEMPIALKIVACRSGIEIGFLMVTSGRSAAVSP